MMNGDTHQNSQEALGGYSASPAPKHPTPKGEGGLGAGGDSRANNGGSSKKKCIVIMVICLLVILVGAVIALMIIKPWEEGLKEEDSPVASGGVEGSNGGDEDDVKDEDGVVEVDLNDSVVQELLSVFSKPIESSGGSIGGRLWNRFLVGDWRDNESKKNEVFLTVASRVIERKDCKTPKATYQTLESSRSVCFDAEDYRQVIKKYFGVEPELNDNSSLVIWCSVFSYDTEYDEIYESGGGCSATQSVFYQVPYKAEREGNKLYIYEVAVGASPKYCVSNGEVPVDVEVDEDGCYSAFMPYEPDHVEVWSFSMPGGGEVESLERVWLEGDGCSRDDLRTCLITDEEILTHLDELDKFKWTFVKDGENYVFEGMERANF